MNYLTWNQNTISDFSENNISDHYAHGYVFTRIGKGVMNQTRSIRIDLANFAMSSENRRILKKTANIDGQSKTDLPLKDYDFKIGKLAKDFYDTKFETGIMSAQKIKEMLTDLSRSNFNVLLNFNSSTSQGFAICYENKDMLHYSYPFYGLTDAPKDMGLGMMIRSIEYAKSSGCKYVYLGSLQRPNDTYKLQFAGLQWFDGQKWSEDLELAKQTLK